MVTVALMSIGQALSGVLSAERKSLNARVAVARTRDPNFDIASFSAILEHQISPLAEEIATRDPEAVRRCALAMFDMAIQIVSHGLSGNTTRASIVTGVWNQIAPQIIPLIASDPVESLGALTNAAVTLTSIEGVRVNEWFELMTILSPQAGSIRELRALIAIAAWRAGAAHLREGALAAAEGLPPACACVAVGSDANDWQAIAAAFSGNRWWRADRIDQQEATLGFTFGQFTGLGGRFSQPPLVRACIQGFFVLSGEQAFLLVADTYGATLHSATPDEFQSAPACITGTSATISGNEIITEDRSVRLDWPAEGLALACNQDSLAVTSPYSHSIRLMPRILA
jgi:hypothetical protein